jgi:uncharacterized protein
MGRPLWIGFLLFTSFAALGGEVSHSITTQGSCLKKISQDRGRVVLVTTAIGPSPQAAATDVNKNSDELRRKIGELKLGNLQLETLSYNVYEDKVYENKKYVSKGYRASLSLSVETSEIPRIGEVIAVANSKGIKQIEGLSTFVSQEKFKLEYEACLETSARNAKEKAQKIAKGLGINLGKVINVSEGNHASQPVNRGFQQYAMAEMGVAKVGATDAGPTIDSRPEDLSVTVTVTFETN